MTHDQNTSSFQSLIKRRVLLVLVVVSLACLLIWIGVSVYFSFKKTSLPPNVQKQLTPITPVIDTKTLKDLGTRRQFQPEELVDFPIVKEVLLDETGASSQKSPTPSPTPKSVSTSSAQPKSATFSAQVIQ